MTCRSCSAAIVWLKTASGASTPVDDSAAARAYHRQRKPFDPKDPELTTHFATCPQARKWSKERAARPPVKSDGDKQDGLRPHGSCLRCGLEWPGPDDSEHECPEGFLREDVVRR